LASIQKVVVTLTAFNEAASISAVVESILKQGYSCVVVDDCSEDGTGEIAAKLGAKVVRHTENLGQGWALLTCFKAALLEPFEIIIEMDADGQHNASEIHLFLERLANSQADIVVGSRILGSNHSDANIIRRTFLPYVTGLINFLTGYQITDAMCGFRAFRASSLRNVLPVLNNMLEPQYIASEMFLRFARLGLVVEEVPIHMQNRHSGKSYKGMLRYGFGIARTILRTMLDPKYWRARKP
jgi:glycosyltransferase involved in cell wall biosynthesis